MGVRYTIAPIRSRYIDPLLLECLPQGSTLIPITSPEQPKMIGQSEYRPVSRLAISFNFPTSAFARIENHYFVNEVCECHGVAGRA